MLWPLIKLVREGAKVPTYQSSLAAGADCYACDPCDDGTRTTKLLRPGERALIPLGFAVAVPVGYEMQLRPRSGLALKHGLSLVNTPGTIDADYRGEVKALVINLGREVVAIEDGERVCQSVIAPVAQATFLTVGDLDNTERGEGGFGHTGKH